MRRFCFFLFLILSGTLRAQDSSSPREVWYSSNASGIALERIPSRFAALREEFSLRVSAVSPGEIPAMLLPYYDPLFRVETRVLFEKGEEVRRQWIFRDEKGTARLNASGSENFFFPNREKPALPENSIAEVSGPGVSPGTAFQTADKREDEAALSGADSAAGSNETAPEAAASDESGLSGFIEVFNADQYLSEERVFAYDGSESLVKFFYNGKVLVRAETWKSEIAGEPEVSAAAELPADESALTEAPAEETEAAGAAQETEEAENSAGTGEQKEAPEEEAEKVPPKIIENGLVLQTVDSYRYTRSNSLRAVERVYHTAVPAGENSSRLAFPAIARGVSRAVDFELPHMPYSFATIDGSPVPAGAAVSYTTDPRGRALLETRKDEEGNVVAETENTWSGDRLSSVRLKAGDEERLIEFEYDSEGNRIMERNYLNGVLERSVRSQGSRDMEELYADGVAVLRAYWEDGRKISEERVSSGAGRR